MDRQSCICLCFLKKMLLGMFFCAYVFVLTGGEAEELIPVVFIHKTNSSYLEHSLWQAKQFNKKVCLIGDNANKVQVDCDHFMISDYSQSANAFAEIYIHQSTSPYGYELFCNERWFILKEFMETNGFDTVFYCDSDVMLYCDVAKEYKNYSPEALLIGYWGEKGSGHCSYFSLKQLQSFCDYMVNFYEHFDVYKQKGRIINDMLIFAEYVKDRAVFVHDLMITPTGDSVFDLNIASSHGGYEMKRKIKAIQWIRGFPYCYSSEFGKKIRFKSLHFQGERKSLMKDFHVKNSIFNVD